MLTRCAWACFTTFVERLLHDAVERRLDLRRKALRRRAPTRRRPRCSPCSLDDVSRAARAPARGRSRRAPRAAARRRAGGRPAASRRRARGARPPRLGRRRCRLASSSAFSPSRIDVSAWPVSSCSSRASRARSSSCASTTRRSASRLTRSERSTATAARAASDSASRTSSSVKRDVAPSLSCATTTPIGRPAATSGT